MVGVLGHGGGDFLEERATGNTNIKKCLGKVADEHFTPAVKVLSSSGIAPYRDDTIKALEAKHPYKPPPSKPSITFFEHPLVAEIDSVFEGSATTTDLLKVITSVVNLWLAGRCLPILAEFVASAPLTPLLKPDNGIRPIVVGTIWRWLVSKVSMKCVGDPLGPLLFALVLHPLVHKIRDGYKLRLHAWYLDDETVIGDSEEVARVLDIIKLVCSRRNADYISGMAMRRAANVVDLMSLLPQLHDLQKVLSWRLIVALASLPIRLGGLGFLNSEKIDSSYAFVASRAQSWVLQDHVLRYCGYVLDFDMTVRQKAVFECLRASHAQDFLLAIPIDGFGQHMSPVEYRTILKYHLMILLFSVDAICPVCRKACLDSFGEHTVHCKELTGFKYLHDMVRNFLFDICRRAGISAKKKAPVNFLTDPSNERSTHRPADVLVFGWVGRKYACVDLTRVSHLVGFSGRGFIVGQTALKAASCKVTKH
ncbi:hypothetical protein Tco_0132479 [Tanacetum coccineum]